jgi:hypothetical protein
MGTNMSVEVWKVIGSSFDQLASEYGGDWFPSKLFGAKLSWYWKLGVEGPK